MYGTVARMRLKPGQEQKLKEISDRQNQEAANEKGYVGELVYKLDKGGNEYILAVVFEDKDSYVANANDPEQHKRYMEYRELLDADPEWNDGEIVYEHGLLSK
jgi:heme-degrading monooxygenase HmoA